MRFVALLLILGACDTVPETRFDYKRQKLHVGQLAITASVVKINGHNRVITPQAPGVKIKWEH